MSDASLPHCKACGNVEYDCQCKDDWEGPSIEFDQELPTVEHVIKHTKPGYYVVLLRHVVEGIDNVIPWADDRGYFLTRQGLKDIWELEKDG